MRFCSTPASLLAITLLAPVAHAQVNLTGGTYSQDFDTLSNVAGSTTNTSLPAGWLLNETGGGARDNEQYAVDTGASNTGDTFSYGAAGSNERALGSLRSSSLIASYGACFTNGTGSALSTLQIAYTGEQWRLGTAARTDRLDFQYSLDATSLTTGSWTDVDAIDFTTPNTATTGAKDGNAAGNRTAISASIGSLSIANGASFCIRWIDLDASGADDGLAIDDFSITAGTPTPSLSINDVSLAEGDSGTTTATFTVSLSQPAGPGGVSFDISTGDGTATAGSDYVALALTGQSIAAGDSSATFAVTINGDGTVEANETFFVNVTNVTGANVGDAQGLGTISNDDAAASPDLTIADVSLFEGNSGTSTARFTVSLATPAPAGGVSFDIATADGTATAGSDYVAGALTAQTIPAGSASFDFDVTINGDSSLEADETFTVAVSNVTGATVLDGSATGTVRNDDVALTAIHALQGAGAQSPLVGTDVTVEGIVTARKFNNGFFLQTADGEADADPSTSQGIFVFTSSAPPAAAAVGNRVRVFGRVTEFAFSDTTVSQLPITQLASATGVTLTVTQISTGNALPTPVDLQAGDLAPGNARDAMERYEGMRVRAPSLVTVAPTNANISEPNATATTGNGAFFATLAGVPRPLREPGLDPDEIVAQSAPGSIPRFDNNAEMLRIDSDGQIGAARVSIDAGMAINNLVGVIDYAFAYYSLLPDAGQLAADSTPGIPGTGRAPTAVAATGAEEITVGGFNLLRFFDSANDPLIGEPVLTSIALDKRLGHTAEAICRYVQLPDVLGVVEVENLAVLSQLADRINAFGTAGSNGCARNPQYVAYLVEGNDVGGIDVGYLVSTREVRPGQPRVVVSEVTQFGLATSFANPNGSTELLNDRPPLLLRAVVHSADGASEPLSIIINHMRSLGGASDTAAGSNGWATAGERVRAKRGAQAQYLAQLVHDRQVADPQERIVLLGDFNVFEFNDGLVDSMGIITGRPAAAGQVLLPLTSAVTTPLTVMTPLSPRDEQYSFSFDGNAQSLDHAVVNQAVLDRLRDVRTEHARINADFAETRFGTGPLRTSDHDPVVLYLRVPGFRTIDLGVDAAAVAGSVAAGNPVQFTIDIANRSAAAADAATLQLQLDRALAGTTVAAPAGWTCDAPVLANTTTVACRATSVAAAASARFTLSAPTSGGIGRATVTLSATIAAANRESASSDNSDTASVTTTSNGAPTARDESYSLTVDTEWQEAAPGVLANDIDPDGDALSARLVSAPSSGTAVLSADGALRYRPAAGFVGEDSLVYEACDTANACASATVRLSVTPVAIARFATRDDRFVLPENAGPQRLDVAANDLVDPVRRRLGSLRLTVAPTSGTARVDDAGTPSDASDDRIVYAPTADRSGEDLFGYRLCEGGITVRCGESIVQVVVRPVVDARTRFEIRGNGGFRDVDVGSYRAMADARIAATPLVAPRIDERPLGVDASPEDAFDTGGRDVVLGELPAGRSWRLLVDAASISNGDVDLYVGLDLDRDGQPSRNELRCTSAMSAGAERCELAPSPSDAAPVAYWVMLHNPGSTAHTARVERFEVPMVDGDGSLAATAPAIAARAQDWPLRLGWRDPSLVDGESRAGYVSLRATDGEAPAWMPVRLDRNGGEAAALPLASGRPQTLRLAPGEQATRLFIDVPPGQTRLVLNIDTDALPRLEVLRAAMPVPSTAVPRVEPASTTVVRDVAVVGQGPNEFTFDAPAAGRWFFVLTNSPLQSASVRVSATLTGTAPALRPGSYFNRARSGHGLFVYPAGTQWAGLWYTYGQDGQPTWYYLQDPAPGANGIWRARLYRSAWNGSRNTLTEVGHALLTSTGPDAFTFTHTVDGETGSEPMTSFGRGCPTLGASEVDGSGLWFNPARAGSGYSVQLFPNYEFHAAFGYDAAGVARFAIAERRGFGGSDATLPLEQTLGFCPLCVRDGEPQRSTVGTLRRVIGPSGLQRYVLETRWANGVPGGWLVDDAVQALGTPQGCSAP
ncbi:Ig-like domain-containing protein [Silanimonas sp.]|uniref:Ig-like domain-containing protein n=1 Tax=Silanimonas sp. TaxID=1929290 RepID=UPI0022C070E2|nr:Ig-like domain-containing protein [Silanimonas sp.]MCZ8114188.1 Ig-like domain-containing protein [Silanimonas sp.]